MRNSYGIPTDTDTSDSVKSLTLISVRRLERKSSTHFTKDSGILLFLRLWASRTCETLSNVFEISSESKLATRLSSLSQIV